MKKADLIKLLEPLDEDTDIRIKVEDHHGYCEYEDPQIDKRVIGDGKPVYVLA